MKHNILPGRLCIFMGSSHNPILSSPPSRSHFSFLYILHGQCQGYVEIGPPNLWFSVLQLRCHLGPTCWQLRAPIEKVALCVSLLVSWYESGECDKWSGTQIGKQPGTPYSKPSELPTEPRFTAENCMQSSEHIQRMNQFTSISLGSNH